MAKFKEGDQVINLAGSIQIPYGFTGTIQEVRSNYCIVIWNNGVTHPREEHELELQLLTEPSSPTPEMGPVEGTMEYWRFLFAGQAMQGILSSGVYAIDDNGKYISNPKETSGRCVDAVQWADALIAELKKGGKP